MPILTAPEWMAGRRCTRLDDTDLGRSSPSSLMLEQWQKIFLLYLWRNHLSGTDKTEPRVFLWSLTIDT
jgi:hypothetical protein